MGPATALLLLEGPGAPSSLLEGPGVASTLFEAPMAVATLTLLPEGQADQSQALAVFPLLHQIAGPPHTLPAALLQALDDLGWIIRGR